MRNNLPLTQQEYRLDPSTTLVSTTDLQSRSPAPSARPPIPPNRPPPWPARPRRWPSAVAKPPAWWPTAWAQVNAAVAELDGLTQQNAAMVEELAAAAQSMCGQANAVTQAVRIFRG